MGKFTLFDYKGMFRIDAWWDDHAAAIEWVSTHNYNYLDMSYDILRRILQELHDALEESLDSIPEESLPIKIVLPGSHLTFIIVDESGNVPNFVPEEKDLTYVGRWFKVGKLTFTVTMIQFNDPYFQNSEDLLYTIGGVTQHGYDFEPDHQMKLSEATIDVGIIGAAVGMAKVLYDLGLSKTAANLSTKALTGVATLNKMREAEETQAAVESVKADTASMTLTSIPSLISSITSTLEHIQSILAQYNEILLHNTDILNRIKQVQVAVGVRNRLT